MKILYVKSEQNVNFKHFMTIKGLKIKLKHLKPLHFYIARENTGCSYVILLSNFYFIFCTGIVQTTAFNHQSKLEGISKYNAQTLDNLKSTLTANLEEGEITDEDFGLVRYLLSNQIGTCSFHCCKLLLNDDQESPQLYEGE